MTGFRELRRFLQPLQARLANLAARALVQLVDDTKKRQLLQIGVMADEDVDDAEHFQPFGFKSVPLEGAEGVVLFPNGDRGHPLVVVVDDRRYRPTAWEPGEAGLYNSAGAVIRLKANGSIEIAAAPGQTVTLGDGGSAAALATAAELLALRNATASALNGIAAGTGASVGAVSVGGTSKVRGE